MDSRQAIEAMCEMAGKSQRTVSTEIGRNPTFIGTTISKGSIPRVDTMAKIAEACGFELVLRGHGVTMELGDDR
jgi:DNA-binding phage protein